MPIDHTGLKVPAGKFQAALDFYLTVLGPLGYEKIAEQSAGVVGIGANKAPDWWIISNDKVGEYNLHVAFRSRTRKLVDDFHAAGLKMGAKCNGPPGLRSQNHPNYYSAFLLDPCGNNIEVVCHLAADAA